MGAGSSLLRRLATAFVLLAVMAGLVWTPQLRPLFSLFIAGLSCIGLYEYYAIVRQRGVATEGFGGMAAGTVVVLSGHLGLPLVTSLALFAAFLLVSLLHMARDKRSLEGMATSLFGVFYVGWLPSHMLLLHGAPGGAGLVTLLVTAVALTDAGALLGGQSFGRHKLAPVLSPNKTWEGAVGGFVVAIPGMVVLWLLSQHFAAFPQWGVAGFVAAGAVVSVASQAGDLAESCLKRSAGVKDSGRLLPGHGGVLDRADGFLFAAPILYYVSTLLVG